MRNMLIRHNYQPVQSAPALAAIDECVDEFRKARWTADELLSRYCTIMYAKTGSYEEAARRLHIDRRTVKSKVAPELLKRLRTGAS